MLNYNRNNYFRKPTLYFQLLGLDIVLISWSFISQIINYVMVKMSIVWEPNPVTCHFA